MKYLLDTDHISCLQRPSSAECAALRSKMSPFPPSEFSFCIVSLHEQAVGAHTYINRARKDENLLRGYRLLREILEGFAVAPVLPFDGAALAVFHELRKRQLHVATMDLRIAAVALSRGMTLLTRNTVDFVKVTGLTIEDWITENTKPHH